MFYTELVEGEKRSKRAEAPSTKQTHFPGAMDKKEECRTGNGKNDMSAVANEGGGGGLRESAVHLLPLPQCQRAHRLWGATDQHRAKTFSWTLKKKSAL